MQDLYEKFVKFYLNISSPVAYSNVVVVDIHTHYLCIFSFFTDIVCC